MYRTYPPSLYDQSTKVPDPGWGLTLSVPTFDEPASVAQQIGENQGVTASAPGSEYVTADMIVIVGELDVSQQLWDRTGPVPSDEVFHAALQSHIATQIGAYAVQQALANAGSISGASSFTAAALFQDIADAKAAMETADGVKLPATHLFMAPEIGDWLTAQSDPAGRPLLLPASFGASALPISTAPDGGPPCGFTGEKLVNLPVFHDGNIPASGSNAQLLVVHAPELFSVTSEVVNRAFPETFASSLSVVVQSYVYVGVLVRHAAAVQVITGDAYPQAPSF